MKLSDKRGGLFLTSSSLTEKKEWKLCFLHTSLSSFCSFFFVVFHVSVLRSIDLHFTYMRVSRVVGWDGGVTHTCQWLDHCQWNYEGALHPHYLTCSCCIWRVSSLYLLLLAPRFPGKVESFVSSFICINHSQHTVGSHLSAQLNLSLWL